MKQYHHRNGFIILIVYNKKNILREIHFALNARHFFCKPDILFRISGMCFLWITYCTVQCHVNNTSHQILHG